MPIDLKWVRSNPDQVREWQNQRRAFATMKGGDSCAGDIGLNGNISIDLVDDVLQKDELSRKNLQNLQEHKRNLKQLQLHLRPMSTSCSVVQKNRCSNENKSTDTMRQEERRDKKEKNNEFDALPSSPTRRQDLILEKKAIESKIRLAEAEWKASLKDTYRALCKLASPVTPMKSCGDINVSNVIKTITPPLLLPDSGCPRSSLSMDLEQAWRQYTLRQFSSYLWVELPGGISIEDLSSGASKWASESHLPSITPDRALELWGCCDSRSSSTPTKSCKTQMTLPSWIHLLTESLPDKSIWGEKELPRYTAIWSRNENHCLQEEYDRTNNAGHDSISVLPGLSCISGIFSLELVALTAPSVVDAREIQNNLVEELLNYYGGLLGVAGDQQFRKKILKRVVVSPSELHNHEWSRIEIHIQLHASLNSSSNCSNIEGGNADIESWNTCNIQTIRLGYVSHWGDAATRACDMSFAGAGVVQASGKKKYQSTNKATTREYVHLVEASVIDDSSSVWNKILYVNSNHFVTNTAFMRGKEDQTIVDIAPVLVPYLIQPISNPSQITLKDLVLEEKKKKKKKEKVFGVRSCTKNASISQNAQETKPFSFKSSRLGEAGADGGDTEEKPKFSPFSMSSSSSQKELQKRIRSEKLSCPYDFLFR